MKKKLQKKISLTRETLRNLSGHEVQGVFGGTGTCCNSSDPGTDTCTCHSRFCSRVNCTALCTDLTDCC